MGVSKKDTEYTAKLARLGLTEEEKELFTGQLNDILRYIDIINSVDTKDISPTAHARLKDKTTPMRKDEVAPFDGTKNLIEISPNNEENMFRVPMIMGTEENGSL